MKSSSLIILGFYLMGHVTATSAVLEDETLNRQLLVTPDGRRSRCRSPGRYRAGGQTVDAVEKTIADRLTSNFAVRPNVFVALSSVDPAAGLFNVYVLGQVNSPGRPSQIETRHHAPAGPGAGRRAGALRRHQAHPAAPHRSGHGAGKALSL